MPEPTAPDLLYRARRMGRRVGALLDPAEVDTTWTTWLFLRGLGVIYTAAFVSLALQAGPLLGAGGLLPAHLYLERMAQVGDLPFWEVPTLFWLTTSDGAITGLAWVGVAGSLLLLVGHASGLHLAALWLLYGSYVNVGQVFLGYGWEILLLETGFLAIFLAPAWHQGWRAVAGDRAVWWLLRWLLFRVMFGAGLIKLRGDPCWRDLTCLAYHFETQPLPNPLSAVFHALPGAMLQVGVAVNHLAEVMLPMWIFAPPPARRIAGAVIAVFLVGVIAGGNFAWFPALTLILCLACVDDRWLRRCVPARLRQRIQVGTGAATAPARRWALRALVGVVLLLSIGPVVNLLSPGQVMNTSFDPLHLVNTYGAFGGIGRERNEIILYGTLDEHPTAESDWRAYEFPCKPGDPARRPCVIAPLQPRLDWQIWFAAMADYRTQPWLVHLVYKLLHADPGALGLLAGDPFDGQAPRWIRADLYRYRFAPLSAKTWWERQRVGAYLPPVSAADPGLQRVVRSFGWPLLSGGGSSGARGGT